MSAIDRRIKSDGGNPLVYDPGILASRNMRRSRLTTGEQILLRLQIRLFDPCRDCGPRRLGQFELHRLLGLPLHDHRSGHYLTGVRHVPNPQIDEITATQLAVDCQVEHGQIADLVFIMEVDPNSPDVLWLQGWLLADQLAFVPGFPCLIGFHVRLLRG